MKTEFRDTRLGQSQPVRVEFTRYLDGGAIAIELVCAEEKSFGEPWMTATVNIPGIPEGCVAVKDYSEGEGLPELLCSAGIIEAVPVRHIRSGYVSIPVFRLTAGALHALEKVRAE